MLSFAMFINFNKMQLLKTVFLVPFLMLCLNAQATNFYVGGALTPTYYLATSIDPDGDPASYSSIESWYPFAFQVHVGVEQELFHFEEVDPEWGHANFGIAARLLANVTFTDNWENNINLAYGIEPYIYLTPSSQLGLKVYMGMLTGTNGNPLTDTMSNFLAGFALPIDKSTEFFFDYRTKTSRPYMQDGSADSTSYNIGVNFKF